MMRILTWTATGFEKMPSNDDASFATNCASSGLSSANLSGKRKRSFVIEKPNMAALIKDQAQTVLSSPQVFPVQQPIRDIPAPQLPESAPISLPSDIVQDVSTQADTQTTLAHLKSREEAQLATMRQTISSQLSLEILMKHRELRLIDQELAKCQIALEQLRRCSEVPYPAFQQPSEQVSTGIGPAIRKTSSKSQARSPAPWGVADGPYSRHYAKWLLSDPHFDGGESDPLPLSAVFTPSHGRSTRGIYTDFAQMVGKTSRSQRALHQGLPAGFVEPKQKPTGPMILKRKSDGKMVKLVCPDCARFDFGSAQGFINHCRIGHQRNFASHDAAAEGCGEAIEADENGQSTGVRVDVVPTPVATTPITPITPIVLLPTTNNSMHPLVRSAHLSSKDIISQPLIPGGYVSKSERKSATSQIGIPSPQCAQMPNLSVFIQTHGLNIDLQQAIDDAKAKNHLDEDWEGDHDMELDSPILTPTGNSRHPAPAGKKPGMKSTESSVGVRKPSFVQARNASFTKIDTAADEHEYHGFTTLLPSPTNESTQAPSLIDDDEEMDMGSPPSSDEHDDSDIAVHVRDDEQHEDAHDLSRAELPSPQGSCAQTNAAEQPVVSRVSDYPRPLTSKDNKQYSFITETPMSGDQGDKKRRKIVE